MDECLIALLASGVRLSMAEAKITPKEVVSAIGAAILLVLTSAPLLAELGHSSGVRTFTSMWLAFFSRDILIIAMLVKDHVTKDPIGALREFLNWRNNRDG